MKRASETGVSREQSVYVVPCKWNKLRERYESSNLSRLYSIISYLWTKNIKRATPHSCHVGVESVGHKSLAKKKQIFFSSIIFGRYSFWMTRIFFISSVKSTKKNYWVFWK